MIDSTMYELVTAVLIFLSGSGSVTGGWYLWKKRNGNGQSNKYITDQDFKKSRTMCREEILGKLETIDTTLRGDGKVDGSPGLVPTIQKMYLQIEEIRTHQKNGSDQ